MMRSGAVFLTFFIVCFMLSGAAAALLIVPMFGDGLGEMLRPATDGSAFPSMIAGFLIFSAAATAFLLRGWTGSGWLRRGLYVGVGLWVVIIGQYAILPGWSTLPVMPTIGSGIVSGLPAIAGAIAAAFVADRLVAKS
ncbi:hypothetical protein [Hyphobacterium sp.]|uniref:hypothetical protein n=1 Tax=Hyphobacterium sp. TaxID=2004662 RepID=UPI003B5286FC